MVSRSIFLGVAILPKVILQGWATAQCSSENREACGSHNIDDDDVALLGLRRPYNLRAAVAQENGKSVTKDFDSASGSQVAADARDRDARSRVPEDEEVEFNSSDWHNDYRATDAETDASDADGEPRAIDDVAGPDYDASTDVDSDTESPVPDDDSEDDSDDDGDDDDAAVKLFPTEGMDPNGPAGVPMAEILWILITGAAENAGANFRNRVIPAAETFLKDAPRKSLLAVFAHTLESRKVLAQHKCIQIRADEYRCKTKGATITALMSACAVDGGHTGEYDKGPCCKVDRALDYMARKDLLNGRDKDWKTKKWVYIADDDVFVRTPAMRQMLATLDSQQKYALNPDGEPGRIKLREWNAPLNECNAEVPQGFFYGFFSAGIIKEMLPAVHERGGLERICHNTKGSYDTTLGFWAWSHGASFLPMLQYTLAPMFEATHLDDVLVVHNMRDPATFAAWDANISMQPFKLPEKWEPQIALRDYAGKDDACDSIMEEQCAFCDKVFNPITTPEPDDDDDDDNDTVDVNVTGIVDVVNITATASVSKGTVTVHVDINVPAVVPTATASDDVANLAESNVAAIASASTVATTTSTTTAATATTTTTTTTATTTASTTASSVAKPTAPAAATSSIANLTASSVAKHTAPAAATSTTATTTASSAAKRTAPAAVVNGTAPARVSKAIGSGAGPNATGFAVAANSTHAAPAALGKGSVHTTRAATVTTNASATQVGAKGGNTTTPAVSSNVTH